MDLDLGQAAEGWESNRKFERRLVIIDIFLSKNSVRTLKSDLSVIFRRQTKNLTDFFCLLGFCLLFTYTGQCEN